MPRVTDVSTVKLTFYPMAGSVVEQFDNLLQTLQWLDAVKPTPKEVYEWLRATFELSSYFARNVYTVILISSGLVSVRSERCYLTHDGRAVLDSASPVTLLEAFEKRFAGIAAVLEVLRAHNSVDAETLKATWFETVKKRFPKMQNWSKHSFSNQCRHRINWLRAMGFITVADGQYALSQEGWQLVLTHPPEAIAIQRHEIRKQEKQLQELALGNFQPFDPSIEKVRSLREVFVRDRAFRRIVTTQYEYCCAVCGFRLETPRSVYEAEAAHIIPKRKKGSDDPRNGISLCGTHHWAFDEGVISVRADNLTVITASYLEDRVSDASVQQILQLRGRHIRPVVNQDFVPSVEALAWHGQHIFLG